MEFELNEEREKYLSTKGKIVLNACPGSGKTTTIAKKLVLFQNEFFVDFGKYSGIACLSFTNTAKTEINEKYAQISGKHISYPHIVSTIDSFINQYITLPFYYLLNQHCHRPKILEDNSFLDEIWPLKNGYYDLFGKLLCFSYPPSSIRFEKDGSFSTNGVYPSNTKVDPKVFNIYCKGIKMWQIDNGLITTGDSAYIGLYLLRNNKKIGTWLATRFPQIIIDEAQDNSAIQHLVFDNLIECGLKNIEFIGDPYQSLYEWRDADPQIFITKYEDSNTWQGMDLTNNWRSNQNIIDCFSILRRPSDKSIRSKINSDRIFPIHIYKYSGTNSSEIVNHFDRLCKTYILTNNQIVVRGNSLKNQILGKQADQSPWKSLTPYKLIEAKNQYNGNEIKVALRTIREVAISLILPKSDYHERANLLQSLKNDHKFNALLLEVINSLPSFDLTISEWTNQVPTFLKEMFSLNIDVDFALKKRGSKLFDSKILKDPINMHFKRSYSESNIPITTIHQVKGKTLDSILIFFNQTNHKENITFTDIENSTTFPNEKQRLIYVAMSRPRYLLAMAFPDSISDKELTSKFGDEIEIINLNRPRRLF
jgi:superfamily I DNA/RNA helicase